MAFNQYNRSENENKKFVGLSADKSGVAVVGTEMFIQRLAYTAGGLPEYVGEAIPGTATSSALWRIKKLTYSGTSVTQIDYADGNTDFDNIWDNHATLSYS